MEGRYQISEIDENSSSIASPFMCDLGNRVMVKAEL
ncbi:uncharacterized protein G2W53_036005 [Senna tora]|uniref:Uncharacterized protein n=1 Tax=Senna tora TaxID=362788 RepID=A0A834SSX3_9FABA|nr:uncharacterized protein G2W53_036005 [Senna tora]